MSYYTQSELQSLGFHSLGKEVRISKKASIYGAHNISIGDHTRIDDFCVLSAGEGGFFIGSHVHLAIFSALIGKGKITVHDFVGISSRSTIYSSNDDYSGKYMTGPTIPPEYTNCHVEDVTVGAHAVVGSGSIILPGVTIGKGAIIGALSLVKTDCDAFGIYVGTPVRYMRERAMDFLHYEYEFLKSKAHDII